VFYFSFKAQGFFFCFNSHGIIPKIVNVIAEYVGAYDFFSRRVILIYHEDHENTLGAGHADNGKEPSC